MVVLSHPTGNTFSRALLEALEAQGQLLAFFTTLAVQEKDWMVRVLPTRSRQELLRRSFSVPRDKVGTRPLRELVRLGTNRLGSTYLCRHEKGWASVDAVYQDLDRYVASKLKQGRLSGATVVYAYEDCALETFKRAQISGLRRVYDLPIAYWETSQRLLKEEAERLPEWEPTLVGTRDSELKLSRKTQELELAEVVVCPSKFVFDSLPEHVRVNKNCIVAEFGTPEISQIQAVGQAPTNRALRALFAGSMTQRKGLADVFSAMKLLKRKDVELVVMGSLIAPMDFYRGQYSNFIYEAPRHHAGVLELMRSCDVLILPSIVEGRALVQQEAMACGLPLIVTANAGGEDLIDEGQTGFLVPIRTPAALAEKMDWLASNREALPTMGQNARNMAALKTWSSYTAKILPSLLKTTEELAARV